MTSKFDLIKKMLNRSTTMPMGTPIGGSHSHGHVHNHDGSCCGHDTQADGSCCDSDKK